MPIFAFPTTFPTVLAVFWPVLGVLGRPRLAGRGARPFRYPEELVHADPQAAGHDLQRGDAGVGETPLIPHDRGNGDAQNAGHDEIGHLTFHPDRPEPPSELFPLVRFLRHRATSPV